MTTETTIQELLKARVKIIAPWPEMERWLARVGDILTDPGGNETVRNQNGDAVPAFEWETYPHLFRKLQWWENRSPEEMPEYVKNESGYVYKAKWDLNHKLHMRMFIESGEWSVIPNVMCFFEPATEADYNSCLSSVNKEV